MITKTITYENFNGEKKTKSFYFHLNKTEIARLEYSSAGGIANTIQKMVDSGDNKEIFKFFEDFVLSCYGEKSADGEEFIKNEEIRNKFQCHPAYDILMMEFLNGGDQAMSDFINAVIPKDVAEGIAKAKREEAAKQSKLAAVKDSN